jgi:YebC/PmpR family DNA-binding regulatory protein
MAGHSKWSQIKHKKALTDAKKSRVFSKLSAMITIAAREKGGDPSANPKLRMVIEKARAMNLPQENIGRAIKRGTGELPGAAIEEALYEGYGPAGVAVLVETLTDNKNRTLGELRQIFSEHQGKLGEAGSAQWMFERVLQENAIEYVAKSPVEIQDPDTVKKLQTLFEVLDEHPDVKEIYSNANFSE